MLTKREARILRRIETGKSHGSNFILQFLERKGLATTHEDGSVVTTPAGRTALASIKGDRLVPARVTIEEISE